MIPDRAILILERQRERIAPLKNRRALGYAEFTKWKRDSEVAIERIFGAQTRQIEDFTEISYSLGAWTSATPDSAWIDAKNRGLDKADAILRSMIDEIRTFEIDESDESAPSTIAILERICLKFHAVARQLRSRHAARSTLEVDDEYDVQDLLHALLRIHFDDIRPEESSPSYAGSGSRLDFLLKDEKIVVEVKKARKGLTDKRLGEELIIDIAKYEHHPDCQLLFCFVYDPEGLIGNPVGLERDLEAHSGNLNVRVIVGLKY